MLRKRDGKGRRKVLALDLIEGRHLIGKRALQKERIARFVLRCRRGVFRSIHDIQRQRRKNHKEHTEKGGAET